MPDPDFDPAGALEQIETLRDRLTAMFRELEAARGRYALDPSADSEAALGAIEAEALALNSQLRDAIEAFGLTLGIDDDAPQALKGDRIDRTSRASLTQDRIAPTASLDDLLPGALDALLRREPRPARQRPSDLACRSCRGEREGGGTCTDPSDPVDDSGSLCKRAPSSDALRRSHAESPAPP